MWNMEEAALAERKAGFTGGNYRDYFTDALF